MKKYLDNDGLIKLYKIIMNKVDSKLSKAFDDYDAGRLQTSKKRVLTFEALEDGTFSFSKDGLSYSLDNGTTWNTLRAGSSTPTVNAGSKVLWKGSYHGTGSSNYGKFSSTGKFNVSGNIMSLMFGDDFKDKTDLTGYNGCFYGLFINCITLLNAYNLILPATTLDTDCYNSLFYHCTSLTTAPVLPATTLAESCYRGMFGETSLTVSPELPATTLASNCYNGMFYNCTTLISAPVLPATKLAPSCYSGMFNGCSSLIKAPELLAEDLVNGCYVGMFYKCSSLNYIKAMFVSDPNTDQYTTNWVTGVSSTGTFVKNADATWNVVGNNGVPTGWVVKPYPDMSKSYLTFKALEDGTFSFTNTGTPTGSVSYSLDNGTTWSALSAGDSTPTVSAGSKVLWKGNYRGSYNSAEDEISYGNFSSTGKFNVSGNIMSLTYEDDFEDKTDLTGLDHCFYSLFEYCSGLIDSSNLILPATTLADGCYGYMFDGCTSLTTAPELPTVTLASNCYESMFSGCTSLTVAPELPATTLAHGCYSLMFHNCTSLTTAPEVPIIILATYCYWRMFDGCTSLTTAPELPATALENGCYEGMFDGCTSLTTAPALPATTLTKNCYQYMFDGCTSLTTAPELPATTLEFECYDSMFQGCTSLTTAPELPATVLWNSCYSHMFKSCTSLTTAPELPATALKSACYDFMFDGCSKLNYIKAMFTTDPSTGSYTYNWVSGVSKTGTFVKNAAATWNVTGNNGIPTGWTVETATA